MPRRQASNGRRQCRASVPRPAGVGPYRARLTRRQKASILRGTAAPRAPSAHAQSRHACDRRQANTDPRRSLPIAWRGRRLARLPPTSKRRQSSAGSGGADQLAWQTGLRRLALCRLLARSFYAPYAASDKKRPRTPKRSNGRPGTSPCASNLSSATSLPENSSTNSSTGPNTE